MTQSKILLIIISSVLLFLFACKKEPTACFKASKTSTIVNDSILFSNTTTNAEYYEWNFGDGEKSTEKDPIHFYKEKGDYWVTLIALNKKGSKSNSVNQKITIGTSPSCAFTFSPKYPKPGESVHFIDNSLNNATIWLWDFGDGTTSTEEHPYHVFPAEKPYKITLAVSNKYSTFKQTDTIHVLNNTPVMPTAKFTFNFALSLNVIFNDQSTGGPTIWMWNFGDGTTSTLQNPIHKYAHGGYYYVTLRVFNMAGSHQLIQIVNVPSALPVASFTYSETENYTIHFQDRSTNSPILWEWNFGDGASDTVQNPIHQYSSVGNYNVTFKVTNNAGFHKIIQTIYVANNDYSFLVGNYNVVDDDGSSTINYTDQITPTTGVPNKFYTTKFGNLLNASVFFTVSGTTITIPTQTINCGTPPNNIDHTFYGDGYFVVNNEAVNIFIDYYDSSSLGVFKHTAKYNKL